MTNLYIRRRKRFLKRLVVTIMLFALVFFFYSFFRFVALRFFGYDLFSHEITILLLSALLVSLLYKPVDYLMGFLFKEILFRSSAGDHSVLLQLSRSMSGILDQVELTNLIVNTFGEVLQVRTASVLIFDKSKNVYRIISAFGIKPNVWRNLEIKPNSLLIELLRVYKRPLERERLVHSFSWQEANQLQDEFQQLHASCVIPLIFQNELIGSINLLQRARMRSFTPQEVNSFFEFASEMAIALRNASLFEELHQNNRELMRIQSEFLHRAQHSAVSQLASGIAHEIHNPLTIISGKAQVLLLKRGQIAYDEQVAEVLKTIVKQTKRAADITRKLLMFSESRESVREFVDFETLVNDTIALLSYQVSLDQIQVVKRFEHPIPKWFGSVGELREAFLNVFVNAVQAVGTRGTIEIVVRYRKDDHMIELKVSDSGPGIPEENLLKVFNPFFTTREGANGLGLFVTQQIVHKYYGSIRIESRLGEGVTFIIELPCEKELQVGQKDVSILSGQGKHLDGGDVLIKTN